MIIKSLTLLTAVYLLLITSLHAGGFHYEINARTQMMSSDKGHINGLKMTWLYDESISKMLLEDEDLTAAKRKDSLSVLANMMLSDLNTLNYFTSLLINGTPASFSKAIQPQLIITDNKQLTLSFMLPFQKGYKVKDKTMNLALADPAGAAIVFYENAMSISMDKTLQTRCKHSLVDHKEFEHGQAAQLVSVKCQ